MTTLHIKTFQTFSDEISDDTEMTFSSQNMNENVDDGHNYYWKKIESVKILRQNLSAQI